MVDWFATAGVLSSAYLLTRKNKWGTITGIAGSSLWVIHFGFLLEKPLWSAVVLNVVFMGINAVGWFRWREDES